jgi:hypothetical protein
MSASSRPTFEERLNDPLSHFPYKRDEAHTGAARDVRRFVRSLELDDETEQSLIEALLPFAAGQVDATAAYVAAQQAYLRDPSDETRAEERACANDLAVVRREYREARARLAAQVQGQEG